ncbi:MAG: OmpA family protein [Parvibaculum sp.]|nr:OmpA family protein [Parvibaculum sp.]
MELRKVMGYALRRASLAMIVLGLAGCANRSYVVLLSNDDGTTGKVLVSGRGGATLLEKHHEGAAIGGPTGKTFIVSEDKIAKDFGAAMAARPKKPSIFLLYFETGDTRLTPESKADIPKILEEVNNRPAPDISIIGHTDTVGSDDENLALGLMRARLVAERIGTTKIGDRVSVGSHGEKNLLQPTPDNTAEPRNRRAEVTVR